MSLRAGVLNRWIRAVERRALERVPANPPTIIRDRFEAQARRLFRPPAGIPIRACQVAGHPGLAIGPHSTPRILYLHGGAYVFGSPQTHKGMLARLSARTGLGAILPDYPKAPEHPFPAATDAALAIYTELAQQGPLILGGDSAGGGLALSLLGRICAEGLPQPRLTFAFSPWADLTLSGDSMVRNAGRDVLLPVSRIAEARDIYLAGADPTDPRASPLFADFTDAGPVRLWAGETELLFDDSRRLIDRLQGFGVDAALTTEPDLPHVWSIFPGWLLPEAEVTLDQVAAAIQTSLDSASR